MEDKREKKATKTRHFNILDLALILLVVLCVVGVFQRNNIQSLFSSGKENKTYTVTFEILKLRSGAVDLLNTGTALYFEEGNDRVHLGVITEHLAVPAVEYLADKEGNIVKAVYPEDSNEHYLDVSGKMTVSGVREDDGSFLLDGKYRLSVNETLSVFTEKADLSIRIVAISE